MFSVIIPLYNEQKNIINLLDEIKINLSNYEKYEIVLIDDGSDDDTLNTIKLVENIKIKILENKKNLGQSFSIHTGIKYSSFNIIITIDGDGQNDPIDINNLLDIYLSNSEIKLVGGIRNKRRDNYIKIISSKIANYIRSKILNDNCLDTGCSLKVFDKDIFLNFPYFDGMHRFLPALFKGYGYNTSFINVNHRKRKFGISKYGTIIRLFKGIRDIIKVKKIIKNKEII
jgi:dolichol-phosphate mannosyltransferase